MPSTGSSQHSQHRLTLAGLIITLGIIYGDIGTSPTMSVYLGVKSITASPQNWFGLDSDSVEIEKVPLVLRPVKDFRLLRIK